ncbi:hypothetical protein COU75_01235 [Candidatus Peregrinibacteria bacterium CG10_big_fil_rev_8_21_14_0_10_42_8]|nr:MAG: hypothetical protein COU75_01235 [Candidatus Peregrinibacteria bacterium CG10_big_fil_rev_8_21_14_0_10_42_8]
MTTYLNSINPIMASHISKTDFLAYMQCPTHFWLRKNKPEEVEKIPLSDFEKQIVEQGIEVEQWARKLYPSGTLVTSREVQAVEDTKNLLDAETKVIFQATFEADGLYAMVDILEWDEENSYWIVNEVKGTTSKEVKKEIHYQDACFQKILLEKADMPVGKVQLIELNKEFAKDGEIDPIDLLIKSDITEEMGNMEQDILLHIENAKKVMQNDKPPLCECIYKARNHHCPVFAYCHPHVPDYSVHDICRIGSSPKKLQEMIDNDWLSITDIPKEYELSSTQQPQVHVTNTNDVIIHEDKIREELQRIEYPIYFLDYETYPAAIPVFDGCYPFQQVPFQYSLHTLHEPEGELVHTEYLQTKDDNPMKPLAEKLRADIGDTGTVIVWNKKFEGKCNEDLANFVPELAEFLHGVNNRFYDLMEIFSKQHYVHKDFKGSSSIKAVLPVLVPDLSYTDLVVSDGGMACSVWKQMMFDGLSEQEQKNIAANLLEYCKLDTIAMVEIWRALQLI